MNRIDELKIKRRGSLLVVLTLGLAAIFSKSVRPAWMQNIFAGTSMDKGAIGFVLKFFSFFLLAGLTAAIFFIIHFIRLIFCQLEIWALANPRQPISSRESCISNNSIEDKIDYRNDYTSVPEPSSVISYQEEYDRCYFLRDGNTIYGPYSLKELNILGYNHNTLIAVDEPDNWHTAAEIFG